MAPEADSRFSRLQGLLNAIGRRPASGLGRVLAPVRMASVGCCVGAIIMVGCDPGAPLQVKKSIPALVADLHSWNRLVRRNAAYTLSRMQPPPPECAAPLVDALKQEDNDEVRSTMLAALAAAAPTSPEIIPAALEILKSAQSDIARMSAVLTLGSLGAPASKQTVPILVSAFDDPICGQEAVRVLGRIGPSARAAVPPLIHALSDRSRPWLLRSDVADAIGAIGAPPDVAVPALMGAVGQGAAEDDERCIAALGHYGASAAPAVPALIRMLDTSRRVYVKANAAKSLGQIGPPAAAAVPSLIHALRDESPEVRIAAAESFARLGPAARQALPDLIGALDDPDDLVGIYAAKSLGAIASNESKVIEALRRRLDDATLRESAKAALGEIDARSPKRGRP